MAAEPMTEPLILGAGTAARAANLPERALLAKRPASHSTGVRAGLTDFAAITAPGASFALAGPSARLDPEHLPVRGDLAHIRLAGKVFVPHYVVPMPHRVGDAGAELRRAGKPDGEVFAQLPAGTGFNVLDFSGDWAWGQVGEDGPVGYVPIPALQPAA